MEKKRTISVIIAGWLLFLPIIWYWGTQIKEWLGSKDYVVPFNWGYAFFPWGLPLSLTFLALGRGVLKLNKLSRILAIILAIFFIVVFIFCVPARYVGLIDWLQSNYGLLYPITILIILNLPKVKEQFK